MTLGRSAILSLTHLEDRTNPADIWVTDAAWNAGLGTLPSAIAAANATPGQDTIKFDFSATGLNTNTPVFNVPAGQEAVVAVGVVIEGGGGGQYVTFTGSRAFIFTHDSKGLTTSRESEIVGGVFDSCAVAANAPDPAGGAIQVTGGQVTTKNTRFTNNSAKHGGAVYVGSGGKLVVDGDATKPTPDPTNFPEQQGRAITLFKKNKATVWDGGAIESQGEVVLKRGWFIENEALQNGGALDVYSQGKVTAAPFQVNGQAVDPDVKFQQNLAWVKGGAIYHSSTATSSLEKVAILGNTAKQNGGAVAMLSGEVKLKTATVSNNLAWQHGGAVAVAGGKFFDNGSTFASNNARQNGGGLWVVGGDADLFDSTLYANYADATYVGKPPSVAGYGHGIYIEDGTVDANVVRFEFNGSPESDGGSAARISTGGTLNTHSCDFTKNTVIEITRNAPGAAFGVFNTDPLHPNQGTVDVQTV